MAASLTITDLLEHEGFVRSLARSLVGSDADADDLTQDTWVAALRNPPQRGLPLTAWLGRVVRNQFRNRRREQARRATRERAAARSEVDDRSDQLAERLELHRRVVDAVLALPSKYRGVLLLRFYDGMSAADIARQRGEPTVTVRSQIRRGLDQIRRQLDTTHPGGREAWSAAMLPWLGRATRKAALPTWIGASIAAILVLAVTAIFVTRGPTPTTPASVALPTAQARGAIAAAIADVAVLPESAATRTPVVSTVDPVCVRCVAEDGRPVQSAQVWLFQGAPRPDGRSHYRQFGPFTTDEQGDVAFAASLTYGGGRFDRWVYARVAGKLVGVGRSLGGPEDANGPIEVSMCPSRNVRGRVSVPDGTDPTTVTVRVNSFTISKAGMPYVSFPRGPLFPGIDTALPEFFDRAPDAAGDFEFTDLPDGARIYLIAEGQGLGQAQYANIGMGVTEIPDVVEITMWSESVLSGVVSEPTGAPVSGAVVRIRPNGVDGIFVTTGFETRSAADGSFRIPGLHSGRYDVFVESEGTEWVYRPTSIELRRGATLESALSMESAVRVSGVVVDASNGEPIQDALVGAVMPREFGTQPRLDGARSDEDGRFELRLPRGGAQLYFMGIPRGYAYPEPQIVDELVVEKDGMPIEGLRFELKRAP